MAVAKYITCSHTTDSIHYSFMTLHEKENVTFEGRLSKQKPLVCDMSIPLYAAALMEFTKETVVQYLNRTYKIVKGIANNDYLNLLNFK